MGDTPRSLAMLTERERQVLRLLLLGHDAKSIARDLAISVHTVNERLRSARHKLNVSSSRGAARLLAAHEETAHEETGPNSLAYETIGVERAAVAEPDRPPPDPRATETRPVPRGAWTGPLMIALAIVAAAAMIAHSNSGPAAPRPATPPRVVATQPRPGAAVPPGPLTLSVTFDRPMRPGNYSFVQKDPATYPQCGDNRPAQSADGRTFTLHCQVRPGGSYEIWFNAEPYMNFKSVDGVPAVPFQLRFRARGE
jgi:DNA-binding CsgD family transcriptional regulator